MIMAFWMAERVRVSGKWLAVRILNLSLNAPLCKLLRESEVIYGPRIEGVVFPSPTDRCGPSAGSLPRGSL